MDSNRTEAVNDLGEEMSGRGRVGHCSASVPEDKEEWSKLVSDGLPDAKTTAGSGSAEDKWRETLIAGQENGNKTSSIPRRWLNHTATQQSDQSNISQAGPEMAQGFGNAPCPPGSDPPAPESDAGTSGLAGMAAMRNYYKNEPADQEKSKQEPIYDGCTISQAERNRRILFLRTGDKRFLDEGYEYDKVLDDFKWWMQRQPSSDSDTPDSTDELGSGSSRYKSRLQGGYEYDGVLDEFRWIPLGCGMNSLYEQKLWYSGEGPKKISKTAEKAAGTTAGARHGSGGSYMEMKRASTKPIDRRPRAKAGVVSAVDENKGCFNRNGFANRHRFGQPRFSGLDNHQPPDAGGAAQQPGSSQESNVAPATSPDFERPVYVQPRKFHFPPREEVFRNRTLEECFKLLEDLGYGPSSDAESDELSDPGCDQNAEPGCGAYSASDSGNAASSLPQSTSSYRASYTDDAAEVNLAGIRTKYRQYRDAVGPHDVARAKENIAYGRYLYGKNKERLAKRIPSRKRSGEALLEELEAQQEHSNWVKFEIRLDPNVEISGEELDKP